MSPEDIAETLWEHYCVDEDYSSMNKREFGELIKEAIEMHEAGGGTATHIKVFEKGCFYDPETDSDLPERELKDTDGWEVVVNRRGEVIVVEHGMHDQKFFHVIENDNDDKYRVERVFPEAK
jgi:hypothetical protein